MPCLGVRCNGSVRSSVRSERPLEVGGCSHMTLGTTNNVMTALPINVVSRIHMSESSHCRRHPAHADSVESSQSFDSKRHQEIRKYGQASEKYTRVVRRVCSFHVAELRIHELKLRRTCLLVSSQWYICLLQPPCP
jgi:hypothetical protein